MNKGIEFLKRISRTIDQIDLVKFGIPLLVFSLLFYFIESKITEILFAVSIWIFYILFIVKLINEVCKSIVNGIRRTKKIINSIFKLKNEKEGIENEF